MLLKAVIFLLTLWSVVLPAFGAKARNQALDECRVLKDRIEKTTELRRRGGSGQQMDEWKRQRRAAEDAFHKKRCRRFSHKF